MVVSDQLHTPVGLPPSKQLLGYPSDTVGPRAGIDAVAKSKIPSCPLNRTLAIRNLANVLLLTELLLQLSLS
jgi:hypothetical protein